jgi:hypothetical protein
MGEIKGDGDVFDYIFDSNLRFCVPSGANLPLIADLVYTSVPVGRPEPAFIITYRGATLFPIGPSIWRCKRRSFYYVNKNTAARCTFKPRVCKHKRQ